MNPPSLPSPSASSTASFQTATTDPNAYNSYPPQQRSDHRPHTQPSVASTSVAAQPPVLAVPQLPATRSGRHLHLLAPLSNRLNAVQPVPSIRIPTNPYAGGASSSSTHPHPHSAGLVPAPEPGRYHPPSNPPSGSSTPHYLYPPGSSYILPSPHGYSSHPYDTYDERAARSPHPPLTAALRPSHYINGEQGASSSSSSSLWPPPLPTLDPASYAHPIGLNNTASRPYYSSPLTDLVQGGSSGFPSRSPIDNAYHQNIASSTRSLHPSAPPLLPPPSSSSRYGSSLQHAQAQALASAGLSSNHRSSPLFIPPPLTFKYSQSPPPSATLPSFSHHHHQPPPHLAHYDQQGYYHPDLYANSHAGEHEPQVYDDSYDYSTMPPRRKPAAGGGAIGASATPQTISSTTSSLRRKQNGEYRLEHTYDSSGHRKDIIVIDDSESPSHMNGGPITRKRTRAMAAAEAANTSTQGSQASTSAHGTANGYGHAHTGSVGSIKRRKVDDVQETSAKKVKAPKVSTSSTYNYQPKALPKKVQEQVDAAATTSTPWDDAEGHYIIKPDDVVGARYKIIRLLGQGTFGKVVEAREISTRRKVAIKIIRAVQKYRDASRIEIRVLETLKKHDPSNLNKCIHLEEQFDHRNHPCLVSELYGMSVFDFLKQNSFAPFPQKHIQDFAKSLFKSVDFLHRLKLVHTDLKPENILLCHNESRLSGPRVKGAKNTNILKNTDIRLIDFGSATFENEYHSSVVSTRHYRAPEIILGLPWSYPCDMFSIGCILVEFFTGDALFQTHDNLEHLAMMEVVMGRMPARMAERGQLKRPEFFKNHRVDYPNPSVSRSSRRFVKGLKPLSGTIKPVSQHNKLFLDLIQRLLDFDPDSRMTVSQALRHPYCSLDLAPP